MKKYLFLFLFPVSLFAASDASDVRSVRVPDSKGVMHNAGDIRDVVKNYPSLKTEILSDAKAKIEASISAAKPTDEMALTQAKITILEEAGGSVTAAKKAIVTNAVTTETQKEALKQTPK